MRNHIGVLPFGDGENLPAKTAAKGRAKPIEPVTKIAVQGITAFRWFNDNAAAAARPKDSRGQRSMEAMLKMDKIDIAPLDRGAKGK